MIWEKFFRENEDIHQAITICLAERKIRSKEIQYPSEENIYRCFEFNQPKDIKVVILGQDPYHGEGEANGLAFSVNRGVRVPPSLKNIYKELKSDLSIEIPKHGDLTAWAKQGVLLLNACLTVAKDKPGSHGDIGWQMLTDNVIEILSKEGNIVFVLWGRYAYAKKALIDETKNLVITSPHPSPFSANKGFFGSKPFSKVNNYLLSIGKKPIDWSLGD